MKSTRGSAAVTGDAADDVTELLLRPRQHYLKARAPRLKFVHDLRRKIRAKVMRPVDALLAVSFSDVDEGISSAVAVQPYEMMASLVRARAAFRDRRSGIPFDVRLERLNARETRAESLLTEAQLHLGAHPDDRDARTRMLHAARGYRAILDDVEALLMDEWGADAVAASMSQTA